MEREQMEIQEDSLLKSRCAIRCAKASMLLLSLKSSSPNHHSLETAIADAAAEEEVLTRKMEDLRMQLVRERMKSGKIKLWSLVELLLHILLLFSCWTFIFIFANSNSY